MTSNQSLSDDLVKKNSDDEFHEQEEKHIKAGEFVKSAVYGGLDGLITTLSIALSGLGFG